MWSAFSGKNKALAEAQKRMGKLPGSSNLLRGLTRFDAAARWSVRRALRSGVFRPYRCTRGEGSVAESEPGVLRFMDYLDDKA